MWAPQGGRWGQAPGCVSALSSCEPEASYSDAPRPTAPIPQQTCPLPSSLHVLLTTSALSETPHFRLLLPRATRSFVNYLAWLQSWKGLGWGSRPMPFCTSSGPTSHRLTSAGAPSFAQGPSDPSLSLHGNINISVHKHWSDNPFLPRALSSPAGVFIDPAQNTSWHSVQDSQKGLLQFRPHHSSLRTPRQAVLAHPSISALS